MRTTLQVTTAPVEEPVSVRQARDHCRIDHISDDELLASYITAARTKAEGYLSRALLTQTLLWTVRPESSLRLARSYFHGVLELPRAPIQSIEALTVLDERGNQTDIQAATLPVVPPAVLTGYVADLALEPGRVRIGGTTVLTDGRTLQQVPLEYLQVSMIAGYEAREDVPPNIVTAILMMVAFLYENRGDAGGEMPKAAEWLLDSHRLQFLGG